MARTFSTDTEAKAQAEAGMNQQGQGLGYYHVFVYENADKTFGVFWHPEDKYIFSFLPNGANLWWHGEKVVSPGESEWKREIVWDKREIAFNRNDFNVLTGELGVDKGSALWDLFTDGAPIPPTDQD